MSERSTTASNDITAKPHTEYETNPFSVALKGINSLKDKANGMFILALVLGVINLFGGFNGNPFDQPAEDQRAGAGGSFSPNWEILAPIIVLIAVIFLASILVAFVLWGMYSYTAARLAKGEGATLGEAFNAVLANFWRLALVALVLFIRLLGWYLLLIIPGIIMQYRYGLSGLIAFAEPELKPSQVVSRSAELTKNAWFDVYGSFTSFSIITLGVMQGMTEIGASSVMYRQLRTLKESGAPKPPTHILSYLLLIIPIILLSLLFFAIIYFAVMLNQAFAP